MRIESLIPPTSHPAFFTVLQHVVLRSIRSDWPRSIPLLYLRYMHMHSISLAFTSQLIIPDRPTREIEARTKNNKRIKYRN
jgi:hypothetical protein